MSKFKYTITKFDAENKLLVATFDDGGWAEIRLVNPLPKDVTELENIVKQFVAPKEAIEARTSPDADLSYIDGLIGIEKECDRLSLNQQNQSQEIDPEVEANMKMWEDVQFQKKVGEALVALGIVETNPATIPVAQ